MSPRSTCDRLRDIEQAIAAATEFGTGDRDAKATAAALYELIVIGEAVNALPDDVLVGYDHVPKLAIVAMRNLAVHAYHHVDATFVWGTVDVDLPRLRDATAQERQRLGC